MYTYGRFIRDMVELAGWWMLAGWGAWNYYDNHKNGGASGSW